MKTFVNRMLLTSALLLGANGLVAAPVAGNHFDGWYEKKFGRPTPQAEARIKAEREATAYRAVEQHPARVDRNEVYNSAKLGRATLQSETRANAERENTAFREVTPQHVSPAPANLHEQYMRGKWGRSPAKR